MRLFMVSNAHILGTTTNGAAALVSSGVHIPADDLALSSSATPASDFLSPPASLLSSPSPSPELELSLPSPSSSRNTLRDAPLITQSLSQPPSMANDLVDLIVHEFGLVFGDGDAGRTIIQEYTTKSKNSAGDWCRY